MIHIRLSHLFIFGAVATFVYFLTALSHILLPFVLGFALAYFLDPVADKLEEAGIRRSLATLTITFVVAFAIIAGLAFGLPALAEQIAALISALPGFLWELQTWMMSQNIAAEQTDIVGAISDSVLSGLQNTASSLVLSGLSILNLLALAFITPIVAVYMLNDWDNMVDRIDHLLPDEQVEVVRDLAAQIDETLGGFARGQTLVCVALGTMYAVGLTLVGLESGIIVGVVAGLISFIPYIGSAVGMVLAGALGLGQFGLDFVALSMIAAVFFVGQFIEGNILTPRLVGDRVKLHPVWIIFALLAMGSLFGFLGLLLAVPMAAILGVLIRYALTLYIRDYVHRDDD